MDIIVSESFGSNWDKISWMCSEFKVAQTWINYTPWHNLCGMCWLLYWSCSLKMNSRLDYLRSASYVQTHFYLLTCCSLWFSAEYKYHNVLHAKSRHDPINNLKISKELFPTALGLRKIAHYQFDNYKY